MSTGLGNFVIRRIPVHGNVTLSNMLPDFSTIPMPTAKDLSVSNTTPHSMALDIKVQAENPSRWSAVVPYANFHVFDDTILLGNATVENVTIVPGANSFDVHIIWDPLGSGGQEAVEAGEVLIGKYISGQYPMSYEINSWLTLSRQEHDAHHARPRPHLPLSARPIQSPQIPYHQPPYSTPIRPEHRPKHRPGHPDKINTICHSKRLTGICRPPTPS